MLKVKVARDSHGRFISFLNAEYRFWVKVIKQPNGCWEWQGAKSWGYGILRVNGHTMGAHRFAYELLVSPITPNYDIDHLCRHRDCVNPAHMECVPRKLNLLRGGTIVATEAAQKYCIQGHPFDLFNTYYWHGHRACRECHRERDRKYWPTRSLVRASRRKNERAKRPPENG